MEHITLTIPPQTRGLHKITHLISRELPKGASGIVHLFLQHTSASLLITEGADSEVVQDLENWMTGLVVEDNSLYTHTYEGSDDMPAHIKTALTQSSLSIPFSNGTLLLGTWQDVFLWEHRNHAGARKVVVSLVL